MKSRIISWILALSTVIVLSSQTDAQVSASNETIVNSGRTTYRYSSKGGVSDFNIEMRGRIEISDDDRDVKSMSDDGYLEINKTVFGSKRTIIIESLGAGRLKREYYEGRTKKEWEPTGRAWLSEILPDVVRNSTIGAESRVARFFKKGGTNAVIAEIEKIESDHAKAHYADLLMKQPVTDREYAGIINTVARILDSDHYLSEFLKSNIDKFMRNKDASAALFNATRNLDSDHYKSVVIKEALANQMTSPENVKIILQSAARMESDHYITEVLTSLLKQDNLDEQIVGEMISTTKSIESDHYKTVVLKRALEKPGLSSSAHQKVIEAVKDIESDHYLNDIIKSLLTAKLSEQSLSLVLELSGSIESDHYRSDLLRTLIKRQDVQDGQFNKLMDACAKMESDHYKTTIFQDILKSSNLSDTKMVVVLNSAKHVDSDHYLNEILLTAAPRVKSGNQALKDAYRQAAKEIDSETYYGRALRAIE